MPPKKETRPTRGRAGRASNRNFAAANFRSEDSQPALHSQAKKPQHGLAFFESAAAAEEWREAVAAGWLWPEGGRP
jgi:hypothetical protein